MNNQQKSEALQKLLAQKLGAKILESSIELGDLVIRIDRASSADVFKILKQDSELDFNLLVDVTAVDWMDKGKERFEAVYHLLSIKTLYRLRVKAWLPESDPSIDSVVSLWKGANFMERETWDMYGVVFKGNSDLRRLLTYDEFVGHALRKDYPVQGKQPRIPLRAPEVENTARNMLRPPLVQINKKQAAANGRSTTSQQETRGVNPVISGASRI